MFRRYDKAVLDFLRLDVDGVKIPTHFPPRREYGTREEMGREFVATPQDVAVQGTTQEPIQRMRKTVPAPVAALSRVGRMVRSRTRTDHVRHRYLRWSDDLNLVTQAQHPAPWDLLYQLDVFTKYQDDANVIVQSVLQRFPRGNYGTLQVDLGPAWGTKKVYLHLDEVVDNSDLEEDRDCRYTVSMTLEAWVPLPVRDIRTVRRIVAKFEFIRMVD